MKRRRITDAMEVPLVVRLELDNGRGNNRNGPETSRMGSCDEEKWSPPRGPQHHRDRRIADSSGRIAEVIGARTDEG